MINSTARDGCWEALMGSSVECHRHLPGGSDPHLSRRKVLPPRCARRSRCATRASWAANLAAAGAGTDPVFVGMAASSAAQARVPANQYELTPKSA